MFSHGPGARRAGLAVLLAGALVAVGGCRSGGGVEIGNLDEPIGDPVLALSAQPTASWGLGRAVLAGTSSSGIVAVVSTTGVYLIEAPGADPELLHAFAEPTSAGTVRISPDSGTVIVTTSTPGRILWFDLSTRQLAHTHDLEVGDTITSLEFLPDGIGVVAGSRAGLSVWPDGPLSGPVAMTDADAPVGAAAVLSDGRVIAPLLQSAALAVIDQLELTFVPLDGLGEATVIDAHASPDGEVLAVTVGEGADSFERLDRVLVLDPDTLDVLTEVEFDRALTANDWTVSNTHLAVASDAGIEIRGLDGEPVTVLGDGSGRSLNRMLPTETGLAGLDTDGAITAWDSASWAPRTVREGGVTVVNASVDPDGSTITTVDFHGRVSRHDTTTGEVVADVRSLALGATTGVAIDADGSTVGVSSSSGTIALLDPTLAEIWVTQPRAALVDEVVFDPGTGLFVTGLAERTGDEAFDDTVTAWDPATKTERFRFGGESEDVAGCAFFYNRLRFDGAGGVLAATSHDFSVSIVDTTTGELIDRIPPRASTVLDVAFTPDGDLLVTSSDDATVVVWDTADYSVASEYQSPMGGYLAIAMLPDSATMVATDITGGIALVDIMTGERLLEFSDARHRTSSIAVSADGTMLAAPASDSTIGVWSVDSGALLATLSGHVAPVTDVAFSPDVTWLASSSNDATIRTWSLTATT